MTHGPLPYYSSEPGVARRRTRHGTASLCLFVIAAVVTACMWDSYDLPHALQLAGFAACVISISVGTVVGFLGLRSPGRSWTASLGFVLNLLLLTGWGLAVYCAYMTGE
jgi:hypothetical protein